MDFSEESSHHRNIFIWDDEDTSQSELCLQLEESARNQSTFAFERENLSSSKSDLYQRVKLSKSILMPGDPTLSSFSRFENLILNGSVSFQRGSYDVNSDAVQKHAETEVIKLDNIHGPTIVDEFETIDLAVEATNPIPQQHHRAGRLQTQESSENRYFDIGDANENDEPSPAMARRKKEVIVAIIIGVIIGTIIVIIITVLLTYNLHR